MLILFYIYIIGSFVELILSLEYIYDSIINKDYRQTLLFIFIAPLFSWFGVYKITPLIVDLWKIRYNYHIKRICIKTMMDIIDKYR